MNWPQWFPTRLRKFMSVGAIMTVINAGALVLLVDVLSIVPSIANIGRTIVMTQVQFGLHLRHTWKDRLEGPFWLQWRRYHYLRVATIVINQSLFWMLITWLAWHYMLAYSICTVTIGILNYLGGDRFVFLGKK